MGKKTKASKEPDVEPEPKKARVPNSAVHQEYEETRTESDGRVTYNSKCHHCEKSFGHKQCSELKRHLLSAHPNIFRRVELADMKMTDERSGSKSMSRDEKIQEGFNKFLVSSGLPMNISDNPEFKSFISLLDADVAILGSRGQSNYSMKKFLNMNQKIKDVLSHSSQIHLTMDMWSRKSLRESFLGVTLHCFDEMSKTRRNIRLALRLFNERHTASNIIQKVVSILDEFQIRNQVRTIITDNGANIKRYIYII